MVSMNRDVTILFRVIASCLTAGLIVFFISALSGEDLLKANSTIEELDQILKEISTELEEGIDRKIDQLGEVPAINPFKRFYCTELAKEIHKISYLTEKQKILFDAYVVRDFEGKSKRLVSHAENGDVKGLHNELEIVKRELKNSANLIDKRRRKLVRQRTAFIVLTLVLWVAIYFYYGRGIIKK